MAQSVLKQKTGVIYGEDVKALFKYAQEKKFAIPAVNVTSSSTVVASLEAARDAKAPLIIQMSQGGAAYFAGKGVDNKVRTAEGNQILSSSSDTDPLLERALRAVQGFSIHAML